MTFLNPLDALIPKIPFSFFPDFWVWVTSEAWGSDSVGFWGSCQLSPFLGGVQPEGSIDPPPPPQTKTRPPQRTEWAVQDGVVQLRLGQNLQGLRPHANETLCSHTHNMRLWGYKGSPWHNKTSIAFGKSTSQRIYPQQHTPKIGWKLHKYGLKHA